MSEETFDLESPPEPGQVPERVVQELRECRRRATDFAQAFGEAIKVQAEKYQIDAAALRKYICSLESDALEQAEKMAGDLVKLIDR